MTMTKTSQTQPREPTGGMGINEIEDVRITVDREGYYLVTLGMFGCKSTNGYMLPRLSEEQVKMYNDRDKPSACIEVYTTKPLSMAIEMSQICGHVHRIFAEETEGGQLIRARIKPSGAKSVVLARLLEQREGLLCFGARYFIASQTKLHLKSWSLVHSPTGIRKNV